MADKPIPVQVEVGRIDSYLFPPNFPIPLIELFANQSGDISNIAEKSNNADDVAYQATVKNNEQDEVLTTHANSIDLNGRNISTNRQNIATNAEGVKQNADDIVQANSRMNAHFTSNSQHGVTGFNVGTENYCELAKGGVVFLAQNVTGLAPYSAPAAPAAYDQTEEQAFRTGVQDAINGIIAKVNEILAVQKNAKQMDSGTP